MYGNTGLLRNTRLSLSAGGHDRTTFYLAGNLKNEEGIIKNTGYDYKSLRANVDHRIGDRITISLSNGFSNSSADRGLTNNDNNGVTFGVALSSTPSFANLFPDDKGNYPRNPYAASNPLETRDLMTNNETTNRYTGSLTINAILYETAKTYTKLVLRGGLDYYNLKTNAQFPRILQFQEKGLGGLSVQGFVNNTNVNTAAYLVNNFAASEKLNLVTSLGTTYESFNFDNVLATASDLIIGQTNIDQAGSVSVSQTRTKQLGNGLFAQEEVNYADMVVATVGVRFDKSTVNGDVNKFYAYPKASVALNITKMPFWASEDVQQLKLRLAYGEAGNFPPYIAKFTTLGPANISGLPGLQIGTTLGNANIAPERQKELEAGFDVAFLQNRLGLEFTYYQKTCSDLILRRNMPLSSGFGTEIGNFGELVNNGFEIKLNTLPVKTENVRWSSTVTFWRNTSEITELLVPAFNLGGFGNTLGTFKIEEGKPATQIVGRFVNSAGESVVEAIGDAEPDFQMGFANELTIKRNLSLSFNLHVKQGGDNINLTELLTDLGGTSYDYDADADGNGTKDALDRINALGVTAEPFVQDASYVKLRELGLFYDLPFSGKKVNKLRLGVSGTNLYTWSKYKSYDPEVSNFGIDGISTGVEVTPYPTAKRILFHLSVDF